MKKLFLILTIFLCFIGCSTNNTNENQTDSINNYETSTNSNIQITLTPYQIKSKELEESESLALSKAIKDAEQKIQNDKELTYKKSQKFQNEARIMDSSIEIEKYKFKYSNKWEIISKTEKSVTMNGTNSQFVFNISETPATRIVDFTSYFIKSTELNLISKSVLNEYNGYIIEAENNEDNMQKTIIMTHNNSKIIIFSINSSKQEWELNSELFDLLFSSLIINQT